MDRRKPTSLHLPSLGACLLVLGGTSRQAPSRGQETLRPAYKLSPGPHEVVSVETLALHDAKRDKDLMVRVTYPRSAGRLPLVAFSHGMFGSKDGNQPLIQHWTSHGYVCIQATHADSLSLVPRGQRLRALRQSNPRNLKALPKWRERPRDMSFVLDSLDEIERQVPGVKGRIERDRIGVGGHSFGAHTSQLIWGAEMYTGGEEPECFRDERVKAVLLLSPQGRGPDGLTEKSWRNCTLPMMTLTGGNDKGRNGQNAKWRLDPFNLCPPGDKYLVWIESAHHNFGGISGMPAADRVLRTGSPNEEHVNLVKMAGLAFWDAYLKGETKAKDYLTTKAIERFGSRETTVTIR